MVDRNIPAPADNQRINIYEDYELQYWTTEFACTRSQLIHAVKAVGVMARKVEGYLNGER